MRNPKRTAASASALMIGVGLVGFITIFVASTKESVYQAIDRGFTGDLVVDSGGGVAGGVDPSLAKRIAALPQVEAVDGPVVLIVTGRNIDEALYRRAVDDPGSFPTRNATT